MGYVLPSKQNHDGECPACHKELTEKDKLDWRVLDSRYNTFSIGEWHYFISGHMLSDVKWLTIVILLFLTGLIVLP